MPLRKPLQGMSDKEFRRWVQRWWPVQPRIFPQGFGLPYLFGDGSDGNATISGNTNLATGTIKQYKVLEINSGVTLGCSDANDGLLIILVSERCIIEGTIDLDGKGGLGETTTADNPDSANSQAGSGGGGGGGVTSNGGTGANTLATGGAGGAAGANNGSVGVGIGVYNTSIFRMRQDRKDFSTISFGGGGGLGGRSGGSNNGGPGGNGGGGLILFCYDLLLASTGVITADGANGTAGPAVDRGGGGGGGGGFVWILSTNFVETGSVGVVGGSGGAAGGGASGAGAAGGTGTIIRDKIPLT